MALRILQILPQDDLPPFDTRRALEVIQEDLAAVKDPGPFCVLWMGNDEKNMGRCPYIRPYIGHIYMVGTSNESAPEMVIDIILGEMMRKMIQW